MSVWHDTDYDLDFTSPDAQRQVAQVSAVNAELEAASAWVFGGGLHAASSATVVRSSGDDEVHADHAGDRRGLR